MIVCVDFDGTIVDNRYPAIGELKTGVREALTRLKELGFYIIIYSCRTCRWMPQKYPPEVSERCAAEMKTFLDEQQIPYDEIDDGKKGKPFADYYIDDRAVRFEDNWSEIAEFVGQRSAK